MENSWLRSTSGEGFSNETVFRLFFVICMNFLTEILRKVPTGYTQKSGEKLNHLLFMDDLMICGKNVLEVNGLVSTGEIFSNDGIWD